MAVEGSSRIERRTQNARTFLAKPSKRLLTGGEWVLAEDGIFATRDQATGEELARQAMFSSLQREADVA